MHVSNTGAKQDICVNNARNAYRQMHADNVSLHGSDKKTYKQDSRINTFTYISNLNAIRAAVDDEH